MYYNKRRNSLLVLHNFHSCLKLISNISNKQLLIKHISALEDPEELDFNYFFENMQEQLKVN